LALDWIHLPAGVSAAGFLASALVPGIGFYARGSRLWGRAAMGLGCVLMVIIGAWFGYPSASVAFGLLLSLHVCGLVYLLDPMFAGTRLRLRVFFSMALLAALACLLYLPARQLVQDHWLLPLRLNGQVIIVNRHIQLAALQRGDRIAYSFDGYTEHGLIVQGGYGFGPVLALPGDQLRFSKETFEVNDVPQPRLSLMPETGEMVVPQKHWFVWPQLGISGHGQMPNTLVAALVQLGTLSEKQCLGKACRRWLWRNQGSP